jgi:hypothetical protein
MFLCSCGAVVNLSPGTTPRSPKPSDYKVQVFQKADTVQVKYSIIGLISVEDSGITISCSYETVFNKAIEKARAIGADAIQIVQVDTPNLISSCYQIKVLAIAFD